MLLINSLKNKRPISIKYFTSFFAANPDALDMVGFDYAQEPEPCRVRDCESMAEFFVFDPATNDEVGHLCMNCFDHASRGAASGTPAYYSRCEYVLADEWESAS